MNMYWGTIGSHTLELDPRKGKGRCRPSIDVLKELLGFELFSDQMAENCIFFLVCLLVWVDIPRSVFLLLVITFGYNEGTG